MTLTAFLEDERALSSIEYALIASVTVIGLIGVWTRLAESINNGFAVVTAKLHQQPSRN